MGGNSVGVGGSHRNLVDPDAMIIGNFYEGDNKGDGITGVAFGAGSKYGKLINFFDAYSAVFEGIEPAFPGRGSGAAYAMNTAQSSRYGFQGGIPANPAQSKGNPLFRHPLNAELHDVRIYDTMRDISDILTSSREGPKDFTDMLFYLPVMFVKSSGKYPRVAAGSCGSPVFKSGQLLFLLLRVFFQTTSLVILCTFGPTTREGLPVFRDLLVRALSIAEPILKDHLMPAFPTTLMQQI